MGTVAKEQIWMSRFISTCVQVSARGEVIVALPPKLEVRCPTLAVANKSLEFTLVSWGALGVDVDWKITKDGVQVAKGKTRQHTNSEQLMTLSRRMVHKAISTELILIPCSNKQLLSFCSCAASANEQSLCGFMWITKTLHSEKPNSSEILHTYHTLQGSWQMWTQQWRFIITLTRPSWNIQYWVGGSAPVSPLFLEGGNL